MEGGQHHYRNQQINLLKNKLKEDMRSIRKM